MHAYHAWRAIEFYIKDSCFYNGCLFLPENLTLKCDFGAYQGKGDFYGRKIKKEKQKVYLSPGNLKRKMIPRIFFMSYLGINVIALTGIPVYASDIFATAKNAMQTVYTDVAGIATVAAVVCAAVCLFLMNFSKSGRTVDESRSWLKRIVVCWAALMTLGAIVTYLEKIIPKSMFTG